MIRSRSNASAMGGRLPSQGCRAQPSVARSRNSEPLAWPSWQHKPTYPTTVNFVDAGWFHRDVAIIAADLESSARGMNESGSERRNVHVIIALQAIDDGRNNPAREEHAQNQISHGAQILIQAADIFPEGSLESQRVP